MRTLSVDTITRDILARYAAASGDPNQLHLKPAVAQSAGFDDVICHGMLSAALVGRLLTQIVQQQRLRALSVRFTAITPVGASLTCSAWVEGPDGPDTVLGLSVLLKDGTQAARATAVVTGRVVL